LTPPPALRLTRLLALWAPLGVTFLLVTGATPVVNAAINRLPDRVHEIDLAAFALFLSLTIMLHSPLFVTREIAIRLSIDRAGSRRALGFCVSAAVVIGGIELLLGATDLGRWALSAFTEREDVVAVAHPAFLYIWPVPIFVAVRGVYQAHQIRRDDTLFVGLGTLVRLIFTAIIGFMLAPDLGLDGAVLGALCMVLGIAIETAFTVVRARRKARPPEWSDQAPISPLRFGLPLMFANMLGVAVSLFLLRVAAMVPADLQESSLAAYQEVRPLAWLFTSGAFALQSLVTAKANRPEDEAPLMRFSVIVGCGLTAALALCVFTPARDWILIELLGERADGKVFELVAPALAVAVPMPFLMALRFSLRGILIARGATRGITLSNLVTLLFVSTAISFRLLPAGDNGALNAYILWVMTLILEISLLGWIAFKAGGAPGPLPPPVRTPREASAG